MSGRRFWSAAVVLGLAGCGGTEYRANLFNRNPPCDRCGQNFPPPEQRLSPFPAEPPTVLPQGNLQGQPYTPPPLVGDSGGGPVGMRDPSVRPAFDGASKYVPEPAYAQVRLDLPVPVRADAKPTETVVTPPTPASDVTAKTETPEPPPVDIPGFTVVRGKVASGQQPFPDGIAWLQTKGYKTVLHLRSPGEDGTAARRQFEKRGLQYISLEVAPGVLTKDLAEQFNRMVADETNLPMFVCDRDGALTGSLWYLHFRLNGMPDDKALAEANRFGFRPDQDEDHKSLLTAAWMLLAAQ
jgi:protein tyrosine phosphatase (PTP) superfamily phosphohydrolase (DUF442 family)